MDVPVILRRREQVQVLRVVEAGGLPERLDPVLRVDLDEQEGNLEWLEEVAELWAIEAMRFEVLEVLGMFAAARPVD